MGALSMPRVWSLGGIGFDTNRTSTTGMSKPRQSDASSAVAGIDTRS
jgi:hypothetical protein